jgi:hypothetical protein
MTTWTVVSRANDDVTAKAKLMSGMEIFYYIVLPVTLVLAGWIALRLNVYYTDKHDPHRGK